MLSIAIRRGDMRFGGPVSDMSRSNQSYAIVGEIKRRMRVATLFPNEASLLRLVRAVLIEVSED